MSVAHHLNYPPIDLDQDQADGFAQLVGWAVGQMERVATEFANRERLNTHWSPARIETHRAWAKGHAEAIAAVRATMEKSL